MGRLKIIRVGDGTVVDGDIPAPLRTKPLKTKPLKFPPNIEINNLSLSFRRDDNQSLLTYAFKYFLVYGLEPYDSNIIKNEFVCSMDLVYSFNALGLSNIDEKLISQLNTLVEDNKDVFKLIAKHNGFNINDGEFCDIDTLVDIDEELEELRITVVIAKTKLIENKIYILFKARIDELNKTAPRHIQDNEFIKFAKKTLIDRGLIDGSFKPAGNFKMERVSNILSHINVCIVCGGLFYSRKASNICSNNTCKRKKTQYKITIERYLNKNNLTFPLGVKDKQRLLKKLKMQVPDKERLLEDLLGEIERDIYKLRDILESDGWVITEEDNKIHLKKRRGLKRQIVLEDRGLGLKAVEGEEYYDRLIEDMRNYSTGKKSDDKDDERTKTKLALALKNMLK